ncbi:Acg family FMN-binding oxidoreductase [Ekhidna sp.]
MDTLKLETLKTLVHYGTKAPSGHNSQPWKFLLFGDRIEIHPDFSRSLPVVDPQNRELYISLGCAAYNIGILAPHFGLSATKSVEKLEQDYFVKIVFEKGEQVDQRDMIKWIEKRQTNRGHFDEEQITQEAMGQLLSFAQENAMNTYFFKNGEETFETLKEYIGYGNEIQMKSKAFKNELLSWIRFNDSQISKTQSGLTYKVMNSPSLPGFLGRLIVHSFLTPKKQNKSDLQKIASSSYFVLFTTKSMAIVEEWVELGMDLQKLLLQLTSLGIANAYLNPPCEIQSLSQELRKELPINGDYPNIILRIGYASPANYAPRRNLEEVILN